MEQKTFTSGPIRPFSMEETGTSSFSDYILLSDSGYNVVYRAMRDGKWWVMKAAKRQEGEMTRNHLLLQREFDIMHPLDCIYVVRAIQMVDDPQLGKAILMEYVDGRTLNEFLAEKPSVSQRKQVLHELLEALTYLHQKGVVHGDLKPDNILITTNGNHVRLIDFGFADNDSFPSKNIGATEMFAAPEIMKGELLSPSQQACKDIYSLGIVMRMIFPRRYKIIHNRCINPDPQKRPSTIAQIGRAIKRNDLLSWLLPVLLVLLAIGASMPSIAHPVSPVDEPQLVVDTVVRRDTVVLASITNESPKNQATKSPITRKDSILNIKRREYEQLYSAYLDSIKSIPDSSYMRAFNFQTQYAEAMYNALQRHLAKYPEYGDEINKEYLIIYERDLPRIAESFSDYKFSTD